MVWNETTQEQYRRPMVRFETDLMDAEWALVEPHLPPLSRLGRPVKTDLREVFNAIQYILGTGCQWRALPPCFPAYSTVQRYYYRWSRSGCKIQSHLSKSPIALEQESNGLDRGCSAWPGGDWRRIGLPDSERVSSGDAAGLEHLRGLSSGLNAAC